MRQFRATQSVPVTLSGRPLPLIYVLLATLVSPPHSKAVVVIDLEGEFDIARVARCAPWREAADAALGHDIPPSSSPATSSASGAPSPCVADEDLAHIYVCLPPETSSETSAAAMVASTRDYMLYGAHESRAREWWGDDRRRRRGGKQRRRSHHRAEWLAPRGARTAAAVRCWPLRRNGPRAEGEETRDRGREPLGGQLCLGELHIQVLVYSVAR